MGALWLHFGRTAGFIWPVLATCQDVLEGFGILLGSILGSGGPFGSILRAWLLGAQEQIFTNFLTLFEFILDDFGRQKSMQKIDLKNMYKFDAICVAF